ncbi:MAG: carboxyl-terminal processing protease, partial [Ulvibacter sp.]
FKNFISFLKINNFKYETETEKEFAEALRRAEDDNLKGNIKSSYDQLMKAIDDAKDKALVSKKAEIMSLLSDEILKRYFYRDGLYNYQVENNPEILEAVSILNNEKRYYKILK